ncbi:MAG: hypothetical protein A2152_02960 [Candidatus Levybacteria bacterium RBG_16_35_6]|nr:MAG: hypothetical protein A2152_02960 [Candidatus Levybacteria bacterium RBG_16_35_6]
MEKLTKKEKKELKRLEKEQQLEKNKKQGTYKTIVYGVIGLVVLALIIWGIVATASSTKNQGPVVPPISSNDITTGSATSKANLIEYADFECPACATYSKYIELMREDLPKDLRVVFRFFPLPQHKLISSQVAYAAYKQGQFWEMYKLLYDNQEKWTGSSEPQPLFDDYAKQLNLDLDKFHNDQNADSSKKFIEDQYNQGLNIGIDHTPTFYLNGNVIEPTSYEEFKALVENEIKKK